MYLSYLYVCIKYIWLNNLSTLLILQTMYTNTHELYRPVPVEWLKQRTQMSMDCLCLRRMRSLLHYGMNSMYLATPCHS